MTTDPALADQLANVIAEAASTHVGPRKMRPLWQAAHVIDWLTKQGSAALVTEQDGRLAVTWPTGRGLTTCTPEVIEGFVGQVNQLRDERDQLRGLIAKVLDGMERYEGAEVYCSSEFWVTEEDLTEVRKRAGL